MVALTRESWFTERYSASLDHPQKLGNLKAFRDSIGFAFNAGMALWIINEVKH